MNRTGVRISHLLAQLQLTKNRNLNSLIDKSLHTISLKQSLVFTPKTISLVNQQRFLFTKKDAEEDSGKSQESEAQEISETEKHLSEKINELEEKNSDLLDKYKRSLADFENLRNRMNKQVSDAKIFGIQGFCKVSVMAQGSSLTCFHSRL